MAARIVFYQFKSTIPKDKHAAWAQIVGAYRTAVEVEKNPSHILIRGGVHDSTTVGGKRVPDKPHITICVKNAAEVNTNKHRAVHGYTPTLTPPEPIHATASGEKLDSTPTRNGKPVWPAGSPDLSVVYVDPKDLTGHASEAVIEQYLKNE